MSDTSSIKERREMMSQEPTDNMQLCDGIIVGNFSKLDVLPGMTAFLISHGDTLGIFLAVS